MTDAGPTVAPSPVANAAQVAPSASWSTPLRPALDWINAHRRPLLAGLVVLYLLSFNGQWRVSTDSALYAALGRSLAEGGGYAYQGEPHTWVEPGLPWLIAVTFRLFGVGTFWPVLVVMLLLAWAALALVYRLFARRDGPAVGVAMALLVGLCETFYRYAFHLFTDTPFLVGALLALNGYDGVTRGNNAHRGQRAIDWLMLAGGALVMVAFRPVAVTFFAAVVVAALWCVARDKGRGWRRHVAVLVVMFAVAFAFRFADPRRQAPTGRADPTAVTYPEAQVKLLGQNAAFFLKRTATELVPKLLEETTPEAIFGLKIAPGVNSALSLAILVAGVMLVRIEPLWGVYVAVTIAQQVAFPPRERYFLPVLPLLIYAGLRTAAWLLRPATTDRTHGPARLAVLRGAVAVAFAGLFVISNLAYDAAFVVEQRRTPFLEHLDRGKYFPWVQLGAAAGAVMRPDDLLLVPEESRTVHYFSRRPTTELVTAEDGQPRQRSVVDAFDRKVAAAANLWVAFPAVDPRPNSGEAARVRALRDYVAATGHTVGPEVHRTGPGRYDHTLHPLHRHGTIRGVR